MTDTVSRKVRSWIMSRIRGRDTKIEIAFRKALWAAGVRYRTHVRMKGTPDLVIRRAMTVVFIDSCFWHGCRWHCRRPRSNLVLWREKLERNRRRDRAVTRHYRRQGWTVLRFWEHQIQKDIGRCISRVVLATRSGTEA
jgi:DNA mismatch endonuclease (patch repair protein)